MKIKRFIAPDIMRSALQQVRQEHGPDAVILSNRMTDAGIEIVAASHYDQEQVLHALDESAADEADINQTAAANVSPSPIAAATTPPQPPADVELLTSSPASAPRPQPQMIPATGGSRDEHAGLRAELAQMRQMIERQMQHLSDERLRACAVRQHVMRQMEDDGFDADLIRDVAHRIPADSTPSQAREQMLELVSRRLSICPVDPLDEGGVIALIGPTGAGKTTTIAKLAAHYSTRHGARDVAIVSLQRGGDALCQHARKLGIALHEPDAGTDVNAVLQRLGDYPLVLVDTPGMALREHALDGHFGCLRGTHPVRPFLVLPATTHPADLDDLARRFHGVRPEGIVVSKLDETSRPGGVLSVAIARQLPLAWMTDGQRLHDDLHRASVANVLLRMDERGGSDEPAQFIPAFAPGIADLAA